MHTLKTLLYAAKLSKSRKGLSWGMRMVMGLFLAIAFGTLVLPWLLQTITGAENASSCSGPYLQAIGSVVADAVGDSPC